MTLRFRASAPFSLADGETRFAIWHMAFEGLLARPITGWGQEGFNYVFNKYYDPTLWGQEQWFDRAHDVFLDWLVAGGVPALLLFLALFVSSVVALYRNGVSRNGTRTPYISTRCVCVPRTLRVRQSLHVCAARGVVRDGAMASSRPYRKA